MPANEFYTNNKVDGEFFEATDLEAIELGFSLLPTMSGNGDSVVVINSAGTALIPSPLLTDDGSTLTISGNLTATGTLNFTGATISDLGSVTTADINGGTIDGTVIGGTTPAAGTFTTFASNGIDDNATGERLQLSDGGLVLGTTGTDFVVNQSSDTQTLFITGGNSTSSGGNAIYYGGSHATLAGDMRIRSGTNIFLNWDESAGSLTLSTGTGAKSTALTLDSSQNATFTGALTCGTFTSTGIDDNATGEVLQLQDTVVRMGNGSSVLGLYQAVDTEQLIISGGTASSLGGTIFLYGGTHATGAGDIAFNSNGVNKLLFDASDNRWEYQDTAIYTTGALTCGTFTSTGIDDNATGERLQVGDTILTVGLSGQGYTVTNASDSNTLVLSGGASGSSGANIILDGGSVAGGSDMEFRSSANTWMLWDESAGSLTLSTGTGAKTTALTIDSSQNVGIGTLDLAGKGGAYSKVLALSGNDSALVLESTYSTGSTWVLQSFAGDLKFLDGNDATNTERMRIDSSGNVGIGTSSPTLTDFSSTATGVHIKGSSQYGTLKLESNDNKITWLATGTDATYFYVKDANPLAFGTNNTERMRIDSSGNLCIGVTSAYSGYKLSTYGWGKFRHPSGDGLVAIVGGSTTAVSVLAFGDTASDQIGSVSYYHSDDSMRFYTNSTERMRIDSSGKVGIGTSSPVASIDTTGDINLGASRNLTWGGAYGAGIPTIAGSAGTLLFYPAGSTSSERMRIDSDGHAIIPAGVTLGTATGVYNAANTLDDYEEGTWTPNLTDGTNSPSYSVQLGVYTKIGNTVYVKGRLTLTSLGSVSGGSIRISGLPFTVNSSTSQSSVNFGYARFISSVAGGNIVGYVASNSTSIFLELYDTTSGTSAAQSSDFTANSALMFDATYLV